MKFTTKVIAVPFALSFVVAACGSPEAQQDGDAEVAMTQEPGVDGTNATAGQAVSEAQDLALRLAAGEMDRSETAAALEDLDRLVNDNPLDFPETIRPKLTEDIASARSAFEAQDAQGLQEAATSIRNTLSASDTAAGDS